MGGWKLEVFKLAMYISFPVGLFYIFNQPQFFEEWVTKARQDLYSPEDREKRRLFTEELNKRTRLMTEKELLKKLENMKE